MKKLLYFIVILMFCFVSCKSIKDKKSDIKNNQEVNSVIEYVVSGAPCYTDPRGKYILIKDMNSGKSWKLTYKQWAELSKMIRE